MEPSIDEGGDWDGTDDPEDLKVAEGLARAREMRRMDRSVSSDGGSLLDELEQREELAALNHPLVRIAPFAIGGAILLAGANIGYMRQMHEYEMEEAGNMHRNSHKNNNEMQQRAGGSKWGNKRQQQRIVRAGTPSSGSMTSASSAGRLASNYGDKIKVDPNWSPHRVAVRALGIGTALAVGTFTLGTAATFWYLEVDTAQGFSDKMNEVIPPKFKAIQRTVRPPLEKLKEMFQGVIGSGDCGDGGSGLETKEKKTA